MPKDHKEVALYASCMTAMPDQLCSIRSKEALMHCCSIDSRAHFEASLETINEVGVGDRSHEVMVIAITWHEKAMRGDTMHFQVFKA